MSARSTRDAQPSTAYELFILVLTVLSLLIMVALLLPFSPNTNQLLLFYDNLICAVFLYDFLTNLRRASPKRDYLIGRRGWLDLLGSVPTLGVFKLSGLLRFARLSRLARISRLLRTKDRRRELVQDVLGNRSEYATFITVMAAFIVLVLASVLVVQFESRAPDANITTGGRALWGGVVTITTVGYGDAYPITLGGRLIGLFVMLAGVGIIASLASILSSLLVSPASTRGEGADGEPPPGSRSVHQELVDIREELAALRRLVAGSDDDLPKHG
jgi:voltage-gated potassium channel